MYVPKHYHFDDPQEIRQFIQRHGFGLLISTKPDGAPIATHIPMMLLKNSNDQEVLVGHIARANEQWNFFEQHPKVLAVFQGPHAFVSSSWYAKENVSTWNYIAVHVNGVLSFIDSIFLMESLKELNR
jgi:transcriptional regulator